MSNLKSTIQLKMEKNSKNILSFFNEKVEFYKISELRKIYKKCIDKKYIYSATTFSAFQKYLIQNAIYKEKFVLEFPSKTYTRYFVENPSLYQAIQSISPNAYFSHYSAVEYHNLTNNIPKTIFISLEKSNCSRRN